MVIYTVLFALSGLAFAAITRNQTAAVALMLLLPSVIEEVIKGRLSVIIRAGSDEPARPGWHRRPSSSSCPYDAGGQMYTQFSIDDLLEVFGVVPFGAGGWRPGDGRRSSRSCWPISAALFLKRDA